MSPQKGHILWDAKSPSCGSILSNFRTEAARKARRLRTRAKNRCELEVMNETPMWTTPMLTCRRPGILCKIARFVRKCVLHRAGGEVSNTDHLLRLIELMMIFERAL